MIGEKHISRNKQIANRTGRLSSCASNSSKRRRRDRRGKMRSIVCVMVTAGGVEEVEVEVAEEGWLPRRCWRELREERHDDPENVRRHVWENGQPLCTRRRYSTPAQLTPYTQKVLMKAAAITENQLQAQIIALQQTVITVLQDALYNDRQLTRADMAKLVAASNSAREGSLRALQDQQHRLSGNGSNRSPSPQRSISAPPKRSSTSLIDAPDQLYCRYSLDLQYMPNKPLAASMAPGGSCECPACGTRLDVTGEDFWMIGKRTPIVVVEKGYETDIMETREFRLGQRFAVKCHTPDGEYACVICSRNREVDAICRNVESLVKHVGTYHEVDELEREVDLRETMVVDKRLSLPAPPRTGSPLVRERDVVEMRGYR